MTAPEAFDRLLVLRKPLSDRSAAVRKRAVPEVAGERMIRNQVHSLEKVVAARARA